MALTEKVPIQNKVAELEAKIRLLEDRVERLEILSTVVETRASKFMSPEHWKAFDEAFHYFGEAFRSFGKIFK